MSFHTLPDDHALVLHTKELFKKQGLSEGDADLAMRYHDMIWSDVDSGDWHQCPLCGVEVRGSLIYKTSPFVNMFKHYKRHHIFRSALQEAIKSMR